MRSRRHGRGGRSGASVSVDTRMDLWRLLAHANVCIDLAPGTAHRPRVHRGAAFRDADHRPAGVWPGHPATPRATGGATFLDASELLAAAAAFRDAAYRAEASASARRYADARYGDSAALVRRLGELLDPRSPLPEANSASH